MEDGDDHGTTLNSNHDPTNCILPKKEVITIFVYAIASYFQTEIFQSISDEEMMDSSSEEHTDEVIVEEKKAGTNLFFWEIC